jgi:hypothetical protein
MAGSEWRPSLAACTASTPASGPPARRCSAAAAIPTFFPVAPAIGREEGYVANPKDRTSRPAEPESTDAPRDAGADAEQRIEQRRQNEKEISRREEEGYDQPQSSAQKNSTPGGAP